MIDLEKNKVKWEIDGGKMKKIKDIIIGIVIGIVIVGSLSVYAVTAVIESSEVTYNNKVSEGRSEDVQGSIDELYERSGVMKEKWVDPILNGADPIFDKDGELIPVEIDGKGIVKYANLKTKWYEYEEKRWANAVILTENGKNQNYKTGDTIKEDDIESYFVWIPRYKYKIWDLGNYTTVQNSASLTDSANDAAGKSATALRRITGIARLIDIQFGDTNEITKMSEREAKLGAYYTHPAFTLGEKELNGIWVGKFEVTGTIDVITVKPGVQSVRNQTVGAFWKALYSYRKGQNNHNSNLDPHMMKNTEWGAVAYLSHSVYGIGNEININNNSEYKTGFSAAANTNQSSYPGTSGTDTNNTKAWNTSTGYLASTTGNITGIYDISGGVSEYMAAYMEGYSQDKGGLNLEQLNSNAQYFDKYSSSSNSTYYNYRILGDATGEMGPFYSYYDKDKYPRYHNAWYADVSGFVNSTNPWFQRGSNCINGVLAGQFAFDRYTGDANGALGSRLVLAF